MSRSTTMFMALAPPAANVPPSTVQMTNRRGGRPCAATTWVGTVVTSSSSMIRGLVSATNAPARERAAWADRGTVWCTRQTLGPVPLRNRNGTVRTRCDPGGPSYSHPVRWPRISVRDYRRVTAVALALLVLIVVTGAAVRLTGSGLGCTDWPN